MGYAMGYHGDAFKGEYHAMLSTEQELIKYENGYEEGLLLRLKEEEQGIKYKYDYEDGFLMRVKEKENELGL